MVARTESNSAVDQSSNEDSYFRMTDNWSVLRRLIMVIAIIVGLMIIDESASDYDRCANKYGIENNSENEVFKCVNKKKSSLNMPLKMIAAF